jgi:hypothetical protein
MFFIFRDQIEQKIKRFIDWIWSKIEEALHKAHLSHNIQAEQLIVYNRPSAFFIAVI